MKKIFAMIMGLIMSLFNSVSYAPVEDKSITNSNFYTIDEADAPDYRELYGGVATASSLVSCKTKNFTAQGKPVNYIENKNVTYHGYWLENAITKADSDLPTDKAYTFSSDTYIIMPYDGTLLTDSTTNNGHNMIVVCNVGSKSYRLKFTKMKCWYCDVGRTEPDNGNYVHTSDNQKGKSFKAGNVLGMAKDGTKVLVHEMDGDTVLENGTTFKTLYTVHE